MNLPENRTIDNSASRRRSRPKVALSDIIPNAAYYTPANVTTFFASAAGAISLPPATIVAGFLRVRGNGLV
jgi:hypothetical protein